MFVVLFGLVGLVVLLPLAGRQANDSYAMTHGTAQMENAAATLISTLEFAPSSKKPWWFADDEPLPPTAGFTNGQGFGVEYGNDDRQYRRARTKDEVLSFVQQRFLKKVYGSGYSAANLETSRREGLAQGFCIDPVFCGSQFEEAWPYSTPYTPARASATQGVFRRTRMPFFDESTIMVSATSFGANAASNYPKLMRVSFETGTITKGGVSSTTPLIQPKTMMGASADQILGLLGDCQQATAEQDKSYGALRGFLGAAGSFISSPMNSRISWLATLTPSEQTDPGVVPTFYNMSFVVFNNRDRSFDAAPLAVTGSDKFALGEKMCFATSTVASATSSSITNVGELPYSQKGGAIELRLWSDVLTDTTIRVGDWVMLSRRMVQGNSATAPARLYKVTHRHSWYRVIGTDNSEVWPRDIRIAGEPWDYPEIGDPNSSVSNFDFVATTVTIFPKVVGVYRRVVEIE